MKSSTTESYSDMTEYPTERHPLEPFLPEGGKILMLGSFPPAQKRWSMDFFYPNWINDMWRIIGTVFFYDKEHFIIKGEKKFDKKKIVEFCKERGIGLYDTATEVRRLKDNASDKFLEIVRKSDMDVLLDRMPHCHAIVTTGQKASEVIAEKFGVREPAVGEMTLIEGAGGRKLHFWRMPSSSRAYPLALEKKAEHYRHLFETESIL